MNLLDLVIVVAAAGYALGGYRSGAVVGIGSLVGFLGGAAIGAQVARPLSSRVADGRAQVPVAVLCVLAVAVAGQVLAVLLARRVKDRLVRGWARPLDAGVGAVLGVVAVLLVSWMVAVPLASSPYPGLASEASQSGIVRAVDGAVPTSLRKVYSSLRDFVDRSGFPPVLGDLPSTSIVGVAEPPELSPAVRAAVARTHRSTFKVYGAAPECGREIEGSAFVYAPHHLLTNAHVVAGTRTVVVSTSAGPLPARVVLFDPARDVAVLDVPKLDAPALRFAPRAAASGDPAVVLGFPQNGPFTVRSARIRSKGPVAGSDIYNSMSVRRDIYAIRGVVRSGNSGGPLITPHANVLGMVFATAADSPDTGFVLSTDEIGRTAASARTATSAVGTRSCTAD